MNFFFVCEFFIYLFKTECGDLGSCKDRSKGVKHDLHSSFLSLSSIFVVEGLFRLIVFFPFPFLSFPHHLPIPTVALSECDVRSDDQRNRVKPGR